MDERAHSSVVFSPIQIFAAIAVLVLIIVSATKVWGVVKGSEARATNIFASADTPTQAVTPWSNVDWQAWPSETSANGVADEYDPDGLSNIEENVTSALLGSYTALSEAGLFTTADGQRIASDIAQSLRARVTYRAYTANDIKTDADTSLERMLAYRNDMRIALEPLLKNPGYELGIFAMYIDSQDQSYAEQLTQTAANYEEAVQNAASVVVPTDSLTLHLGVLNALAEFGATVGAMASHGGDAFASAALLQSYSASEQKMLLAFDALATHQRNKTI